MRFHAELVAYKFNCKLVIVHCESIFVFIMANFVNEFRASKFHSTMTWNFMKIGSEFVDMGRDQSIFSHNFIKMDYFLSERT